MTRSRRITTYLLLVLALSSNQAAAQNEDYYCGSSFDEAMNDCPLPCSSGEDSECSNVLGGEYDCYYFTGCADKIAGGFVPTLPEGASVQVTEETQNPTTDVPTVSTPASKSHTQSSETQTALNAPTSKSGAVTTNAPTNERTQRIKTPTLSPLSTVATTSPVLAEQIQTTALPTSDSIKSIKTATRREINGNSPDTSTSYGYIFNVRTTPQAPILQILSLDFLTASTSTMKYELYSKEGSFVGFKGHYGRWRRIGQGSVVGMGIGTYTSIPLEKITPVTVDGLGGVRSFYLTLSTKDLIYRTTSAGSTSDEAVQQSTEELEVYEGENVQAFPFPLERVEG